MTEQPMVKSASGAWNYPMNGYHISTVSLDNHRVAILQDAEAREGEAWNWAACDSCAWRGGWHYDKADRWDKAVADAKGHLTEVVSG